MSMEPEELEEQPQEPVAHVRIVYQGPVAPHWDIQGVSGDQGFIDEFRQRAMARLQLLPPHDPQFRRNRERVNRDAEREFILLEWDLGYDEEEADATALGDKPASEAAPAVAAAEAAPEAAPAAQPKPEAEAEAEPEAEGTEAPGDDD